MALITYHAAVRHTSLPVTHSLLARCEDMEQATARCKQANEDAVRLAITARYVAVAETITVDTKS